MCQGTTVAVNEDGDVGGAGGGGGVAGGGVSGPVKNHVLGPEAGPAQ